MILLDLYRQLNSLLRIAFNYFLIELLLLLLLSVFNYRRAYKVLFLMVPTISLHVVFYLLTVYLYNGLILFNKTLNLR